jgi:hypothetical protein
MSREIDNGADIIDSRDVIARIEELQDERQFLADEVEEAEAGDDEAATQAARAALAEWDGGDEAQELRALMALQDEAEGYSDWTHGATLIRDSYFPEYARDLAEELHGNKIRDAEWPFSHIDWDAAADKLLADYASVSFDGVDYWVRS